MKNLSTGSAPVTKHQMNMMKSTGALNIWNIYGSTECIPPVMMSRELEFDFEKVKLKSKDNPLYYVQYSYARICSIFSNSKTPINNDYKNLDKNFEFNDEEIKIIRKLSEWPKCIETSINKLEPHRLTTYLYQLASIFHSYWNMGRDSEDFRFLDKD